MGGREGVGEGREISSLNLYPNQDSYSFFPLEEHLLLKPCKNQLFFLNQWDVNEDSCFTVRSTISMGNSEELLRP